MAYTTYLSYCTIHTWHTQLISPTAPFSPMQAEADMVQLLGALSSANAVSETQMAKVRPRACKHTHLHALYV